MVVNLGNKSFIYVSFSMHFICLNVMFPWWTLCRFYVHSLDSPNSFEHQYDPEKQFLEAIDLWSIGQTRLESGLAYLRS